MTVDMDPAPHADCTSAACADESEPGWNIVGVVQKKIISSKRLVPVIAKR